ncbi:hypothetical protein D9M71_376270 [compost metagenome]
MYSGVVVVDHIAIGAIAVDRQCAELAIERRADRPGFAGVTFKACPYCRHADRITIRIDKRHLPYRGRRYAGVHARGAVIDAAFFGRQCDRVLGMRRVVGAADDDHQLGGVGQPGRVDDLVSEDDIHRRPACQGNDGGVVAIDVKAE